MKSRLTRSGAGVARGFCRRGPAFPATAQERPLQPVAGHQPLDPFTADPDTAAPQRRVDPRDAVGGAGAVVDVDDLGQQRPVDLFPLGRFGLAGQPAVERRRGDVEDPEYRLDPEPVAKIVTRSS